MTVPTDVAHDLVRCSLLAHLAAGLGDPDLCRRAASEAAGHARMLAGLHVHPEEDGYRARVLEAGLTLDELFVLAYPNRRPVVEDEEPAA
jgi:hypothetical protein